MRRAKVLFFVLRNLHLPHLYPVYRWMQSNANDRFEVTFGSAPVIDATIDSPGYGIDAELLAEFSIPVDKLLPFDQIQSFAPEVVVMADADYRSDIDQIGAKIVNVNHGLISKGAFYTDAPLAERDNIADLICVPGSHHKQLLQRVVKKPILVTGLTKFDPVWSGELKREDILRRYGVDPVKKVVLFAPTFTRELSAVPMVTDSVTKWLNDDMHLLIKLHGMSPPEWIEMYRLIAQNDDKITYVEDMDLTPALVAADLMVSDVSSAFMEFAALDKPVVLVNNPKRTSFIGFDPRDIEYTWRDIGVQTDNPDEIADLIRNQLSNPKRLSEKRMQYTDKLVGPRDGKAGERIANGIEALIE
ncbi:CDP-glycerol glycerophosphotransferase family protein [Calditrichota bacterium]